MIGDVRDERFGKKVKVGGDIGKTGVLGGVKSADKGVLE